MVGLYLSHSGALDGARPVESALEHSVAPPRGTNQTHLSSGLATDCETQVNPGRYCFTTLSLVAVVDCDAMLGLKSAFHSHCCLSVFQVIPARTNGSAVPEEQKTKAGLHVTDIR